MCQAQWKRSRSTQPIRLRRLPSWVESSHGRISGPICSFTGFPARGAGHMTHAQTRHTFHQGVSRCINGFPGTRKPQPAHPLKVRWPSWKKVQPFPNHWIILKRPERAQKRRVGSSKSIHGDSIMQLLAHKTIQSQRGSVSLSCHAQVEAEICRNDLSRRCSELNIKVCFMEAPHPFHSCNLFEDTQMRM